MKLLKFIKKFLKEIFAKDTLPVNPELDALLKSIQDKNAKRYYPILRYNDIEEPFKNEVIVFSIGYFEWMGNRPSLESIEYALRVANPNCCFNEKCNKWIFASQSDWDNFINTGIRLLSQGEPIAN